MRIVLFGATLLSARCLNEIISIQGCSVAGVVTNQETFKISYNPEGVKNVLYGDLAAESKRYGIPSYIMQETMKEEGLLKALTGWNPDLILVIGWYHMVPKLIRDMAPLGCAGVHSSLLPRYRGGAPLVWAMINGELKTGVSLFYLGDGVDDGDIIGQGSFDILTDDTIAEVLCKCEEATAKLLRCHLPLIQAGTASRTPQDASQATIYPQRSPADGCIDWSWPGDRIDRFIRAQTKPYPGAYTDMNGKRIRIWNAQIEDLK